MEDGAFSRSMAMKLQGKIAVITGGARGLGRSYAIHLARLGADIVIADVNLESAKEVGEELYATTVTEEIENIGRKSLGLQVDVGKKKDVEGMFQSIAQKFEQVDILINNAGGLLDNPESSYASMMGEKDLMETLNRNLIGTINCCQAVSPLMKKKRSGKIINVASFLGLQAEEGGWYASYGVAKAGIIQYTRYLAAELGPFGVNVNCIAPGYVRTKRLEKRQEARKQEIIRKIPLGRIADPEDVAKVIEFFCTDLSNYVTGQCLPVCGGLVNY
jgi:NAD(P)-dependent dehydrogenase (short-subunit alcohol dehydrogenase family)